MRRPYSVVIRRCRYRRRDSVPLKRSTSGNLRAAWMGILRLDDGTRFFAGVMAENAVGETQARTMAMAAAAAKRRRVLTQP